MHTQAKYISIFHVYDNCKLAVQFVKGFEFQLYLELSSVQVPCTICMARNSSCRGSHTRVQTNWNSDLWIVKRNLTKPRTQDHTKTDEREAGLTYTYTRHTILALSKNTRRKTWDVRHEAPLLANIHTRKHSYEKNIHITWYMLLFIVALSIWFIFIFNSPTWGRGTIISFSL